jgi:hypothetical protein
MTTKTKETIKYNAANWIDGEVTATLDRRPLIDMEYVHVTTHTGAKHTTRIYSDRAETVTACGTEITARRYHGEWMAESMGVERWGDCPVIVTLQVIANI